MFLIRHRHRKHIKSVQENLVLCKAVVPPLREANPRARQLPAAGAPTDLIFFCRRVYDCRQKRLLKKPTLWPRRLRRRRRVFVLLAVDHRRCGFSILPSRLSRLYYLLLWLYYYYYYDYIITFVSIVFALFLNYYYNNYYFIVGTLQNDNTRYHNIIKSYLYDMYGEITKFSLFCVCGARIKPLRTGSSASRLKTDSYYIIILYIIICAHPFPHQRTVVMIGDVFCTSGRQIILKSKTFSISKFLLSRFYPLLTKWQCT